ncbi:TRAP transporter small permease subunit [Sinisalibacter aestuarii]|nr:TRAP transporter small permease subunit [Sinisalibacter aestuarii]
MILAILVSVAAAFMGWSVLLDWEGRIPLFGAALTVNSMLDMQWFIFALIVLFGGIWSYFEDRHVTVDFLAVTMSPRTRAYISLIGDIFLLLPFCMLSVWYGSKLAMTSFRTGEGSTQGGLESYWLIKGALPIAFALLGVAAIVRILRNLRDLRANEYHKVEAHHDS